MHAIQIKSPALTIKAGPRALARIKANGLASSDVGILPGAAGGPKALGIQGLDLALHRERHFTLVSVSGLSAAAALRYRLHNVGFLRASIDRWRSGHSR